MSEIVKDNNSEKRRNVIIAIVVVILFIILFPRIMYIISVLTGRYQPHLLDRQINNVLPITPTK